MVRITYLLDNCVPIMRRNKVLYRTRGSNSKMITTNKVSWKIKFCGITGHGLSLLAPGLPCRPVMPHYSGDAGRRIGRHVVVAMIPSSPLEEGFSTSAGGGGEGGREVMKGEREDKRMSSGERIPKCE